MIRRISSGPRAAFIGLTILLFGSAGSGLKAAGRAADLAADPNGPAGPPDVIQVENLGSGWPKGSPLPQPTIQPLPKEALAALTLARAVELSNQRNPVVRQSYNELVAAQNSLGSAFATWWPVINANLNYGVYGEQASYNYTGALQGGPASCFAECQYKNFSSNYFQSIAQFDINWNIYDPKRTATIWQNKYLVRQAVDSYIIARRDNKLRTEQAFINLQSANAKVITGQQLVANDQLLYRLAETRFRLGVASKLELAKQLTVLKTDQVNLLSAQQGVQVAQAVLAELLAVDEASAIGVASVLEPLGTWNSGLKETVEASFGYRKVIEQKLTEVKINEAQAKIDLSVYRPTSALVNSLYWTHDFGYTGLTPPEVDNAHSDFFNGSSAIQLTFTGFDGGAARMSAASSMAKARAAADSVQGAVNQVRKEAQSYYADADWGRKSVYVSSERVKAASQALRLQSLRFNAGYGNITDVVQAQQDLTQSVSAYIEVLTAYNQALVNLARASGLSYRQDPQMLKAVGNPLNNLGLPGKVARMR
jgi:outer membrane protein TolC